MNKLLKLKAWVTVLDAARHLSIIFDEKVTEADVLQLALDGQLQLSINFVNGTLGRPGQIIPITEAEYKEVPSLDGAGTVRLYGGPTLWSKGQESHVVKLEKRVADLVGVYDLPMIGSERLDVEHRIQQITGGPPVTRVSIDGAFVTGSNGRMWQLLADFADYEYTAGSKARLEELKQKIVAQDIGMAEAEASLNEHKEKRKKSFEEKNSGPSWEDYHPAGGLPLDDSVFVVRTDALREFEAGLNESTQKPKRESPRKTENLLAALVCVAIDAYGYDPRSSKNTAPNDIANALATLGFEIDERTIRGWLSEGNNLLPPIPHKR